MRMKLLRNAGRGSNFMSPHRDIVFPGLDKYPSWLWWSLILAASPVFAFFLYHGQHFRALVSSLSVGVIVTFFITLRSYQDTIFYWTVGVACILCHAALVMSLVVEYRNFAGTILTPVAVADLLFWQYALVTILRVVKR